MSWLRTQLVLFVIGFVLFKVSESQGFYIPALIGFMAMVIATVGTLYTKQRFTQLFDEETAVTQLETIVKLILSSLVLVLALGYLTFMWMKA